ncbi:hypothetical protein CY35_10G094200 [Sphagnum magellanicum]|nr:hypothetical protein CY35_10G094200 [Sphagnum magellanicum]
MLHVVGKPLWRPTSNQHLPMLTTLIPSRLSLKLPVSFSAPRHLRERIFLCSCGLVQAAAAWADERACAAPCSFRELQTRTAVKIQGRGKIQLSAVQLGKHSNDMEEEDDEDVPSPHTEDKETRGESETKALRAQDWAVQLASLSPSQLHLAKRWARLSNEVFEAIMLVKSLSIKARNTRQRQIHYIGCLLHDMDPVMMDLVLKACKGCDPSEPTALEPNGLAPNPARLSEAEISDLKYLQRIERDKDAQMTAKCWIEGLLAGDESVTHELFSYSGEFYFDQQKLKKLIEDARERLTHHKSEVEDGDEDSWRTSEAPSTLTSREQIVLHEYLLRIARGMLHYSRPI